MRKTKNAVSDFLMRHKMHYNQIDMNKCLSEYLEEMGKGLNGEPGSLLMLPSYVRVNADVRGNKKVIAVDAGGTNLRTSLVCFDEEEGCCVQQISKYSMPGTSEPVDRSEFFLMLESYIEPLLGETDTIVISFAYPTEILPNQDGRILKMVKEINIQDVEGCLIGEELNKAIALRGYTEHKVYVTNDTVAVCLAGAADNPNGASESFIGVVLGTGMNTAYIENIGNVKKLSACGSGGMIINTESGNYNRQPRGDIDIAFDRTTKDAGQNTLEKMISGGYFGALIDYMIRFSERDELFSLPFYNAYLAMKRFDTIAFAEFENGNDNCALSKMCKSPADREKLHDLFVMLVKRAARLVALQIAGAAMKSGNGGGCEKPISVTVEGSTFYKLPYLKEEVTSVLETWFVRSYGVDVKIVQVENAVLKGAAIAGLLGSVNV